MLPYKCTFTWPVGQSLSPATRATVPSFHISYTRGWGGGALSICSLALTCSFLKVFFCFPSCSLRSLPLSLVQRNTATFWKLAIEGIFKNRVFQESMRMAPQPCFGFFFLLAAGCSLRSIHPMWLRTILPLCPLKSWYLGLSCHRSLLLSFLGQRGSQAVGE